MGGIAAPVYAWVEHTVLALVPIEPPPWASTLEWRYDIRVGNPKVGSDRAARARFWGLHLGNADNE
jgi:hypothetical protein